MLDLIWAGMILAAIVTAAFTGNMGAVTTAAMASAKEAVSICAVMLGVMGLWAGLMRVAENAGLVTALSRKMTPILSWLFPDLPPGSKAARYIAANMLANVLGLGWASTPAGLKAMAEMDRLNQGAQSASRSMCMFMIVNMSSLQLVTMSIVAYRLQYGSANPSEIIGPGIAATAVSTTAGVLFAKLCERRAAA